ncbi:MULTISPECIES: helix-turn-helix domain-containing protein [unclassified Microbacterium]|uniref:helix-turn-helix domain-containing protein n=1 Tax=unclassified Microbacterium TaxID=2609290 RepID=UPI0014446948
MVLPHRRQQLAKFIPFHDLTRKKVAAALGCSVTRVSNLCKGGLYPTPDEIATLERLFGMPVEVLLEPALLEYRHSWPPLRGLAVVKAQIDRDRHEAGE